jgi:hypothetical protein
MMVDEQLHAIMLFTIAYELYTNGDWDGAESVAHTIADESLRTQALTQIAESMVEAGDFDRAERLVYGGIDSSDRAEALMAVAVCLAERGEGERAETLARSIDTNDPAHALAATAAAAAEGCLSGGQHRPRSPHVCAAAGCFSAAVVGPSRWPTLPRSAQERQRNSQRSDGRAVRILMTHPVTITTVSTGAPFRAAT